MGNNNSSHSVALSQPPPNWTQSFPREKKRSQQNKHGSPENKVLPERIPGQRLRPTENGHILHTQGTISARHLSEFHAPHHPGQYPPPGPMVHPMMQPMPHHHSMTHLHHQMPMHGHHSGSTSALHHQQMYDERAASMHNLRIGYPPKNYASEPDLRGASPPVAPSTPHTIINQGSTKGKIKSKKKSKAPTPPKELQSSYQSSEILDYSVSSSPQNQSWPQEIQHPKEEKKTKSRKIGLFRKKHESRKSQTNNEVKSVINEDSRTRSTSENYRAMSSSGISPREEIRERARSLDCLQHELRQSLCRSPPAAASLTHLNHPAMNEQRLWATLDRDSKRRSSGQFEQNTHKVNTIERESRRRSNHEFEARRNSTIEREQRSTRRMSTLERKVEERKLLNVESRDGSIKSSIRNSEHRNTHHDFIKEEPLNVKDAWDEAEEEIETKKKENALFQAEILRKSKSLKTKIPDEVNKKSSLKREIVESHSIKASSQNEIVNNEIPILDNEQPKTFFFGMEPPVNKDKSSETNTGLAKIKAQDEKRNDAKSSIKKENTHIKEEIRISGESVEFSRRTLERKEKDKSIKNSTTQETNKIEETKKSKAETGRRSSRKLSKDVEDFAVAIERNKLNRTINEDGASGSSRPDGGYHSRQNSGSFHLDTEQEDNENELSMNLRPTLPRRQLEIPRFSPNQAWRSLSLERPEKQQPDPLNESRSSEDPESVFEARIQRYTRPTAPPRGSGEKSADSGISGDAGSPGPTHEFEPLTSPQKSKTSSGPLAVSSPVTSGRAEMTRAWTPAQDLDDNSLDGSGEPVGLPTGLATPPKLTVRSNMFSKSNETEFSPDYSPELPEEPIFSDSTTPEKKESYTKRKKRSTDTSQQKTSSLRKIKQRQVDSDDTWRDNWSMSRSIPTSLNTCEEHESVSNLSSHRIENRSRSESRVSRGDEVDSRPRTPAYSIPIHNTYGSGAHIMYLPDYKSSKLSCDELSDEEDERRPQLLTTTTPPHPALHDLHHCQNSPTCSSHNSSGHNGLAQSLHQAVRPLTPDTERKPPSGDECPQNPENNFGPQSLPSTFSSQFQNVYLGRRGKKSKKFSYQSTVRILEKRKLEEKITREVEEKERLRLSEAEQMRKVEEEFQRKREREKKIIKNQMSVQQTSKQHYKQKLQHQIQQQSHNVQQLQLHRQEEKQTRNPQTYSNDHNTSNTRHYKDVHNHSYSSDDHVPSSSSYTSESHGEVSSQDSAPPPPLPTSPTPTQVYIGGYNPLSVEPQVKISDRFHDTSSESNSGVIIVNKSRGVKGHKESHTSSSVTITSATRQAPDGADASDSPRKPGDDFRAEIIAASRQRNANSDSSNHDSDIISNTSSTVQQNSSYQNNNNLKKSSVRESHKSSHSHRSSSQSNNSRTHSPDTRKLTQELPEHIQERREYFEYRGPSRHLRSTNSPSRNSQSSSSKSKSKSKRDNYRAEFCHGSAHAVIPSIVAVKSKYQEDIDRYSKQSNDERVSVGSSSAVRSVSIDHLDKASTSSSYSHKKTSLQHHAEDSYTHNFNRMYNGDPPSSAIDSSPARFAHNLLQPFNGPKGYRPVAFTPPPPTKILHVN